MRINKDEVRYIAKLSKLSFSEEETEEFIGEFNNILNHFENIEREEYYEIEVNNFDNTESILREDEVKVFENKNDLFRNVKSMRDTNIEIPKVME
ncbi:Asp-tRNA(Asn)/Glu-tRNA(Gln) amidotransferase subunit GatC [Wukongibacter baidiensis]|uniref:Asp-tRNA(Asn)/Glu-tRNA(Gln) amidotransferase subunit GatC n=1 Tax=Wukongibacter baidiensis TaxID=1723361 RepID=UPI003D7FD72D